MIGRFWAVGVGPGDPELLTLKAVRLVREAHVVYHAGPVADQGRALAIVRSHLRSEQDVRSLNLGEMEEVATNTYQPGVQQIAAECHRGRNVVFITEGDPTVYSTASRVWQLLGDLAPDISIEVIPGVSSVTAAAARVGWPLAQKDETLIVVPARYHIDRLRHLLEEFSTVVLLKPGRALPQIIEDLKELGPGREAVYLEELGMEREFITRDLASTAGRQDYFALVLVRRTAEAAASTSRRSIPPFAGGSSGKVWVVGLGPGDIRLLTGQAREALHAAEVVVGYDGYLRLLEPLGLPAEVHGSSLGAEAKRAALALDLARRGRRVTLVSSGDAGVYGMASLLLESAGTTPDVEIEIVPGITAVTAAAALLGAPLGHDFACISLSDLLTPWEIIESRLDAAGRGDFVVALYNPVSQRRTWQLPRARDILLQHRPPNTPVGVVERAYRAGTQTRLTTLGELTVAGVTMETLVLVGSTTTRVLGSRLVTPRGYGRQP